MLYAHSHPELPEAEWQTLEDHHNGVAELARIAAVFGTPNTAELLGNIHDTGAHGHSMGYNYNGKLRSAEVLLKEDGSFQLIRRAETVRDYLATFDFCDIMGKYLPKKKSPAPSISKGVTV